MIALSGNFIPNILGLITLSIAFKYASLGGLNQGILPTLTSLAGVYSAIIFYFKFHEKVSFPQIVGMILMLVSVVFLGLEGATKKFSIDSSDNSNDIGDHLNYSSRQKIRYAIYAILWGLVTPFFYTTKAYCIRVYCGNYKAWDLGIDALIFESLCYTIMYVVYIYYNGFVLSEFLYGQLISVLQLIGTQALCIAYSEGPGGPINTILIT